MNWEKKASDRKKRAVVIDDSSPRIETISQGLAEEFSVRTVSSPFKLLSMLCTEKPDLIVLNSSVPWFSTSHFCCAVTNNGLLADTPIVLFNTENTSVNRENIGEFRNCHIIDDTGVISETARRLVS
ncbi:MAG TPA: hypothetical protein P5077_07160 [bacterium]|nr:hypothetical protein [bacterium]